jgi:membrane dipeptidase
VWDNHTATTLTPFRSEWLAQLQRHRNTGVDVVCLNVGFDAAPPLNALLLLAEFRRWLRAHSDDFTLLESVDDIEAVRREGKLGVCFNLEGGCALFGNVNMVSLYYDLGVRWMLFAYNKNNILCGGCQDEDTGLSAFGRTVIEEMERVGMVVCCSHIGQRSAMEVLEHATRPVIFSHSNPHAVWQHPRNISDEAIRACARSGGVVGVNGIGIFLGNNDISTELIVRHIDYVANLVGPEHVGIGLDYCYDQQEANDFVKAHPETYPPEKYPNGLLMMEPERLPAIAEQLLKIGYSEDDVRNVLGGNHLRIARQVWK